MTSARGELYFSKSHGGLLPTLRVVSFAALIALSVTSGVLGGRAFAREKGEWMLARYEGCGGGFDIGETERRIKKGGGEIVRRAVLEGWCGLYDIMVKNENAAGIFGAMKKLEKLGLVSTTYGDSDEDLRGKASVPLRLYVYLEVDPKKTSKESLAALKGGKLTESQTEDGLYWLQVEDDRLFSRSLKELNGLLDVRVAYSNEGGSPGLFRQSIPAITNSPTRYGEVEFRDEVDGKMVRLTAVLGRIIVYTNKEKMPPEAARRLFRKHGGRIESQIPETGYYLVAVKPGREGEFIDAVRRETGISSADPVPRVGFGG